MMQVTVVAQASTGMTVTVTAQASEDCCDHQVYDNLNMIFGINGSGFNVYGLRDLEMTGTFTHN